jgi:3-dehydroquinate synthase
VSFLLLIDHEVKLTCRLGAYHAPTHTFLDFSFLKTLPEAQTRNGFAELVKIASVGDKEVWDLLVKHGKKLVETGFGYMEGGEDVRDPGQVICEKGIDTMLELETPNLHELGLDRVIAFGHTWSPTLELTPKIPLRHGHAITVSMLSYLITSFRSPNLSLSPAHSWSCTTPSWIPLLPLLLLPICYVPS